MANSITKFDIPAWLIELAKRFFTSTPKFFTILKTIGAILAIVTGLPGLLESAGIVLPEAWSALQDKTLAIIGIVTTIISQLTTDTNTVAVKETTLPFTTKSEAKKSE